MNPSKIEWTDTTWNPVTGCTKVSQGCKNCYAERVFPRPYPGRAFTDVRTHPDRLDAPLRMKKGRRIFVNSMSDLFHEDVPDDFIDQVFAVMGACQHHTFQVLTKRPSRMLEWFSERWQPAPEATQREIYERHKKLSESVGVEIAPFRLDQEGEDRCDQVDLAFSNLILPGSGGGHDHFYNADGSTRYMTAGWPFPNVWLGVSVEDQATADERIPQLLRTPAAVRFVSAEPLLGPIDLMCINAVDWRECYTVETGRGRLNALTGWCYIEHLEDGGWVDVCEVGDKTRGREAPRVHPAIDLVIAGGESGPKARPSHPNWFRSLRDQCANTKTPFFFKQWGEWWECDLEPDSGDGKAVYPLDPFHLQQLQQEGVERRYQTLSVGAGDFMRVGKKAAGRLLDGRTHSELPA